MATLPRFQDGSAQNSRKRRLRASAVVIAAAAAMLSPWPAAAQISTSIAEQNPVLKLFLCRNMKADDDRLKCFDQALDAMTKPVPAVTADTAAAGSPEKTWSFVEDKSPIDDSPQIYAYLMAENDAGSLNFRCREHRLEGFFLPRGYINSRDSASGIYRIGEAKPVSTVFSGSSNGQSAFLRNTLSFLRGLPDDTKLFLRALDFQGVPHDATFDTKKISEVRARLLVACPPPAPKPAPTAPKVNSQSVN